jgi:hypothetical protein
MSIAAKKLLLLHRGVRKKKSYRAAAATRRLIKKFRRDAMTYKLAAMVSKTMFQISVPYHLVPLVFVPYTTSHSLRPFLFRPQLTLSQAQFVPYTMSLYNMSYRTSHV